jgi:protein SCO1/2
MSRTLAALAVVLCAAAAAAAQLTTGFRAWTAEDARRIRVAEAQPLLSSVALIDRDGSKTSLWSADPQVRAWLVTFMYTDCPSVCLALGSEFQQMQASMGADEHVRLASLSFDRARDTPEALAAYATRFRADPARWLVAVPERDIVLARLLRETGVVAIDDGAGGFMHNAAIHVVTSSGRLVALYDLERYDEALVFARALAN